MKKHLFVLLISFMGGIAGAFTFHQFTQTSQMVFHMANNPSLPQENVARFATYSAPAASADVPVDFAEASRQSTPSVVYIKTVSSRDYGQRSWLEMFFEGTTSQQVSTGSGVIYTQDGYIITNNHVVENASQIEVVHQKRSYQAEVVGVDPSTDLAVLKVESQSLPAIRLGSSRDLAVGEWVLAVGNPFNLTSTVTAGIVSAKGREINILKSNFPIESFIQTDAAINPGNSGGALVDKEGYLIGINTAILSQTGSYAGYGFAVPVDIVRKVVDDIIQYGVVQKAFFGADVIDLNASIAQQLGVDDYKGVAISYLQKEGAALKAGLQKGDIILKINGENVNSHSDFDELISYYSPGELIEVQYKRNTKIRTTELQLTNREGNTELIIRETYTSDPLGASLERVSRVEADLLNIDSGVKITNVSSGFIRRLGIEEGFVVTSINKKSITSPEELEQILTRIKGKVIIEGVNNQGVKGYYSYYF